MHIYVNINIRHILSVYIVCITTDETYTIMQSLTNFPEWLLHNGFRMSRVKIAGTHAKFSHNDGIYVHIRSFLEEKSMYIVFQ